MTNETNKAYKMGYVMARADIEEANPERNRKSIGKAVKETMYEFHTYDEIFEGICDAAFDYENGNEWKF
jgi:hypothetical protein